MAFIAGVLVGLVLGLTGAGGSVLAVPLLMALLGLSLPLAAGLSLGAVGTAAVLGVILRLRHGVVAWAPAFWMVVGGMALVPLGQRVATALPEKPLLAVFVVLVVVVAVRLWRQAGQDPAATREIRAAIPAESAPAPVSCRHSETGRFEWRRPCILRMVLAGALTGMLAGLFGVGGGFVVVPALVLLTGLPMAQAVATSLVVISVVACTGFATFLLKATLPWYLLAQVAGGGLAGMLAGTVLGRRVAGPRLQRLFAVLMLAMAGLSLSHVLH